MPIEDYFEVLIDDKELTAKLIAHKIPEEDFTEEEIIDYLKEEGIIFGINKKSIAILLADNGRISAPLVIASGKAVEHGTPAKLSPAVFTTGKEEGQSGGRIELRDVLNLENVTSGMVVGRKISPGRGINGMNVFGEVIQAKPGKDFTLRPGKNTRIDKDGEKIIATCNGLMSADEKMIHVQPVYEVPGDVTMKTGNIDFTGTVKIRGSVPSGFKIKAGGDITVFGSVEGAELESGGSVYVCEGIVSQGKGYIKANRDVHTSFANQATIYAGNHVFVSQSILHSKIEALGKVVCKEQRGNVVGGSISSGQGIDVNEAGNQMNTPTLFYLGVNENVMIKEKEARTLYEQSKESMLKLSKLYRVLEQKKMTSTLGTKDRLMMLKVQNNLLTVNEAYQKAKDDYEKAKSIMEHPEEAVFLINRHLHPNVSAYFGKYRRKIVARHERVTLTLNNSEITLTSL
ncbi:DUF342 domain-containing protein [Alteribacter keqinensis]|uniref:DUF342 domain-containing protein n=1 Tax=Alteribacter keqinensis TaxID=2483800 RepID=A0A3M7TV93_9BACI|nr:FapA family protein [Alteribacter keqinensis]RNA69568.1 DUF342 domain-containing protein [Alteribacter keqinensis]